MLCQRVVTAELRQKVVDERRSIRLRGKLALQALGGGQAVTKQGKVTRRATPRGQSRKGARDVGHRLQPRPHALAPNGVLMQPRDQPQAEFHRATIGEWRRDVLAQQAAAGRGLASVDLPEQAACRTAAHGARKLQAVAAGGVDRHMVRACNSARRVEEDAGALLGRVEVGKQAARRRQLRARWSTEPVQGCEAEA